MIHARLLVRERLLDTLSALCDIGGIVDFCRVDEGLLDRACVDEAVQQVD